MTTVAVTKSLCRLTGNADTSGCDRVYFKEHYSHKTFSGSIIKIFVNYSVF